MFSFYKKKIIRLIIHFFRRLWAFLFSCYQHGRSAYFSLNRNFLFIMSWREFKMFTYYLKVPIVHFDIPDIKDNLNINNKQSNKSSSRQTKCLNLKFFKFKMKKFEFLNSLNLKKFCLECLNVHTSEFLDKTSFTRS